jgi:hypothetical protein
LSIIALLAPAHAAGDPPARVGRLSLVEGAVTYRSSQRDSGSAALVNWPISSGAIVDTERRARAEVWIGSTAYRLGGDTQAEFASVDDRSVNLLLHGGTLAVTIRDHDQADDLGVMTPAGQVRFSGTGRYRLEVTPDRTMIAAQSGSAEIFANERPVTLRAGEMVTIDGRGVLTIDTARYGDDFDAWVSARDNREKSAQARRNVSPYMTGYDDLDAYGDWNTVEDYGTVWYPRAVGADWAPYRYGRWAWVEPWGWTWIDAAPWGFAPFHYGRWVQVRGRWGWAPGAYVARPVYAPALVGWVGNPGWNASFSVGSAPAVGWFPLAPREVYVPAYRTSPTYIRQINLTHVRNTADIDHALRPDFRPNYAHHGLPHAVTVVPTSMLRDGRQIDRTAIRHYDRHELGQSPATARAPGSEWLTPGAGAARPGRPVELQRRPLTPLPALSERPPQPATRTQPVSPDARQSLRMPEAGAPFPGQDASRVAPNDGRNQENRGRFPFQDERQPGRAVPSPSAIQEAPRVEQRSRPMPGMPSLSPASEASPSAAPLMREMPRSGVIAQEPRRPTFGEQQLPERPAMPDDGRNPENRGRFPFQDERQPGRAGPSPSAIQEAPRVEQRSRQMPVMPSQSPAPEPLRPAPSPMREMPPLGVTAQDPRREMFRQAPPQERPTAPIVRETGRSLQMPSASGPLREMPQAAPMPRESRREPMPHERPPAPVVREAPRPMPPPPAAMREMPRPDQRPSAHGDRDRGGNPWRNEVRGERGMQ